MKQISSFRKTAFFFLNGFALIVLFAGCGSDSVTGGGGGGGCAVANCFGGGGSGGGGSQNPNLSISAVPGDRQNTLTFSLTSGNADSFNIYWSTSPETTTPTWNKIEGVTTSSFVHDNLTNGIPRFYGVTAVSGGSESQPSAVVGAMPGKWMALNPLAPPPKRDSHTAVYNRTTDRMIVFGGKTQATTLQDLWTLSNASGALGNPAWNAPNVSSPPPIRASHTAVYSKQANKMIVFAGSGSTDGTNLLRQDLWSLSDADSSGIIAPSWQLPLFNGSPPSPRWGHAAVYDEQADIMIVFGGAQTGVAIFNDVWVLEDATQFIPTWRQIAMPATGGPSTRCCMAVGYDSANRRMIVFGGFGGFSQGNPILFGDLWTLTFNATFTTATWKELTPSGGTAPSARCCAASFWDGSKFLLFGGGTFSDSSDDKIHALVLLSSTYGTADGPSGGPPARSFATAVPAGHFLLFGGTDSFTPLNDLWRLE